MISAAKSKGTGSPSADTLALDCKLQLSASRPEVAHAQYPKPFSFSHLWGPAPETGLKSPEQREVMASSESARDKVVAVEMMRVSNPAP